jgi:hypothetical protein
MSNTLSASPHAHETHQMSMSLLLFTQSISSNTWEEVEIHDKARTQHQTHNTQQQKPHEIVTENPLQSHQLCAPPRAHAQALHGKFTHGSTCSMSARSMLTLTSAMPQMGILNMPGEVSLSRATVSKNAVSSAGIGAPFVRPFLFHVLMDLTYWLARCASVARQIELPDMGNGELTLQRRREH